MGRNIIKVFIAVLVCYVAIALGALYFGVKFKELISPLLSLVGTFIGALFAFKLTQIKEDEKEHAKRRDAINRTIFLLSVQSNAIWQLREEFNKFSSQFEKAFFIKAIKSPSYDEVKLNLVDLEFILSTSNPQLLLELALEFQRFHQAIVAVNLRSEFYVSKYLPKLAERGGAKFEGTEMHMREMIGDEAYYTLLQSIPHIFELLGECEKSIPNTSAKLLAMAKKLYPKHKFIAYAVDKSSANQSQ